MSQQLTLQESDLKFKLKVRYESEPNTILETAHLISRDLRVKVKDIGILFETKGKAWVVETLELNDEKMLSTVVQQTVGGAWIAFEVVHEKDVAIEKMFIEVERASRDLSIMMYPMYFVIGVLMVIEFLLIKKTVFEKELIILTRQDWQVIMWISIAVIGWFGFLLYYVRKQRIHEAYFQSIGLDYTTERTLDFYFLSQSILKQKRTLRYTITLQCLRGYYYHPDLPEKVFFSQDRTDILTLEDIKHQLKLATDAIKVLEEKEFEIYEEIETIKSEERELQRAYLQHDDIELEERLKEISTLLKQKKDQIAEIQKEIAKTKEEKLKRKAVLQKEFFDIIKDVFGIEFTTKHKEKKNEFLYAYDHIQKLRSVVADLRNQNITLKQALAGTYNTLTQLQDTFNQQVAEESARRTSTNYEYLITDEDKLAQSEKQQKQSSSVSGDMILNALIKLAVFAGVIGGLVYAIITIIKNVAALNPLVAVLIILGMAIALTVAYKLTNRFVSFATDTNARIKLQ